MELVTNANALKDGMERIVKWLCRRAKANLACTVAPVWTRYMVISVHVLQAILALNVRIMLITVYQTRAQMEAIALQLPPTPASSVRAPVVLRALTARLTSTIATASPVRMAARALIW